MKVEHLTLISNHSEVRETTGIQIPTIYHFSGLQIKSGSVKIGIEKTNLSVKATIEGNIGIFDLMKGDDILFSNVCCFDSGSKDNAMYYVKELAENTIFKLFGESKIRQPVLGMFLYTVPVNPFTSPADAKLCGEIEFYIYFALLQGVRQSDN